jgi:hypothetical protein
LIALQALLDQPEINEDDRHGIVQRAVFNAAASKITAASLRKELGKERQAYLKSPETPYILVTTMSLQPSRSLRRILFEGSTIQFSNFLPPTFQRLPLMSHRAFRHYAEDLPAEFVRVRAHIVGRTEYEAGDRGIASLDYLRVFGILSLTSTRGLGSVPEGQSR